MGRKPELDAEAIALKALIREAHEATQGLNASIKEARALADQLVSDFEVIHAREIKQLSNFFTEESNRHAAGLNTDVARARDEIFQQLAAQKLVLDKDAGEIRLLFNSGRFDDHQPLPYPNTPPKETP